MAAFNNHEARALDEIKRFELILPHLLYKLTFTLENKKKLLKKQKEGKRRNPVLKKS